MLNNIKNYNIINTIIGYNILIYFVGWNCNNDKYINMSIIFYLTAGAYSLFLLMFSLLRSMRDFLIYINSIFSCITNMCAIGFFVYYKNYYMPIFILFLVTVCSASTFVFNLYYYYKNIILIEREIGGGDNIVVRFDQPLINDNVIEGAN